MTSATRGAGLVALLLLGCSARALDLVLAVDPACAVAIPAGGSLLYELVTEAVDGGDPPRECGACIAVPNALSSSSALLAFLRAEAPSCPITRETRFQARVTSFAGPGCAIATAGDPATRFCSVSALVAAGSGRSDESVAVPLSCADGCADTGCVPLSCSDQGKTCGSLSDTCGGTLDCGTCSPPQKCGGGGVPNVCAKP